MNSFYHKFIESSKAIAYEKNLPWELPISSEGNVDKEFRWDIAKACGMASPPYYWHSSLGCDASALNICNSIRQKKELPLMENAQLSGPWKDFYQAVLVNEIFIKRNKPRSALNNTCRSLRIIATCAGSEPPWSLSPSTVQLAYNAALEMGASGKAASNVAMVIRVVIDALHIADQSPLSQYCKPYPTEAARDADKMVAGLKQGNNSYRHTVKVRKSLSERSDSSKLPEKKAFLELLRIVFMETPKTFSDAIRFDQIKLAIACGFRVGECTMLPVDWARWSDYIDSNGGPAGKGGGISRSLSVRHFAEKQSTDKGSEGLLLYEALQHAPALFENLLIDALSHAERLTSPLRNILRRQVETGRLFPEHKDDELVPLWDMYARVSGSIRISSQPLSQGLIDKYRKDYCSDTLSEIWESQKESLFEDGPHRQVAEYWKRLRESFGIKIRTDDGRECKEINGETSYIRVGDVEGLIRKNIPSKLPDTDPFLLHGGQKLSPAELMFLMPVRALVEGRGEGIVDVNRYFSIGRASTTDLQLCLGGRENTIFSRYGMTDEDRSLKLNPHSLRHLQNAELFRLGVADTIITKQFNRHSIAQSYVYDHRSLAEDLAHIDLPPGAEVMTPRAQEVFQLIKGNKVKGPIVDEFLKIQKDMGDDAAFNYLSVEADGLHVTPYGFCVNSFTVDPCPKHLECYNGCRHLTRSPVPEEEKNLENLKVRMISVVKLIEATPEERQNIGWRNQLEHAKSRLENIEKLLTTIPGEKPFPDGIDLHLSVEDNRGTTIFDGASKIWRPE